MQTSSASGPSKSSLSSSILGAGSSVILMLLTGSVTVIAVMYFSNWGQLVKMVWVEYMLIFCYVHSFPCRTFGYQAQGIVHILSCLTLSDSQQSAASILLWFSTRLEAVLADILLVSWMVVRVVGEQCDLRLCLAFILTLSAVHVCIW